MVIVVLLLGLGAKMHVALPAVCVHGFFCCDPVVNKFPTSGEVKVTFCAHIVLTGVFAVLVEAGCGFEVCVAAVAIVALTDAVEVRPVFGFVGEAGCAGYAAIGGPRAAWLLLLLGGCVVEAAGRGRS